MDEEGQERQLNIHLDPDHLAGVYANFANISFSDYEFTITFARIDHEVEEGDVPGVVVSRVNMSTRFMRELLDAMNDSWSKWSSREGIRNLPETTEGDANRGSNGCASELRRICSLTCTSSTRGSTPARLSSSSRPARARPSTTSRFWRHRSASTSWPRAKRFSTSTTGTRGPSTSTTRPGTSSS